jgi:hypothetical protein
MSAPMSVIEATLLASAPERTVDTVEPWIQEDIDRHHLPNALRKGVPEMRRLALECQYMWPNPGELEQLNLGSSGSPTTRGALGSNFTLYGLRVARAYLSNVYADTLADFSRIPFRSSVVFDGWSEELQGSTLKTAAGKAVTVKGWKDNVDGTGYSFNEYAHARFEDKLFDGIAYTFIDNHPGIFNSPAERRLAKAWPRLYCLRRSDIRNFILEERDGVPRIKQLSFVQPLTLIDASNIANVRAVTVDTRKVVVAGDPMAERGSPERKVRTFTFVRSDGRDPWQEIVERRGFISPDNPLDEMLDIPLVPHYAARRGPFRGDSQFLNTAWIQSAIWNHNSERTGLAREASLTFVTRTGVPQTYDVNNAPVLLDTRNMRYFESSDASASTSIAEVSGSSLASLKELIEEQKADIRAAHHQIFVERPSGPVTATEITMEGVHASTNLEMQVVFEEHAWQKICEVVSLLAGWTERGTASIPHDFGLPAADLDRNDQLFTTGNMSPESYWKERVRAGSLGDDFNLEKEVAWWEKHQKEQASMGGVGDGGTEDELT